MKPKKNPRYNQENFRGIYLLIGLVVSLLTVFAILGIHKTNVKTEAMYSYVGEDIVEENVVNTVNNVTPPPPPPSEQVADVLQLVTNNTKVLNTFFGDPEIDENSIIQFNYVPDEPDPFEGTDSTFISVQKMPEFPGGERALIEYIGKNTDYPELAKENGIQGTVYVRFVVKKNGSIGEVQLTRGVDPLLDEEALRVVKGLPNFKPGYHNGKPVNVWFSVPILFKLTD